MEERAGADRILLPDKGGAAFAENLFEILDGLEKGIDQGLILAGGADALPPPLGEP